MKPTRRQLIHGTALGTIGALAGCTSQIPGVQSEAQKLKREAFRYEPTSPKENTMVEDGQLKYPQLIQSPSIEQITQDTLSVMMRIMPNPVDDYELEVYCTPLSEYGEGWGDMYPDRFVSYDEEEEEWNLRGGGDEAFTFPWYKVNGHGTKIASRTIHAKSAGLSSSEVSLQDLPDDKKEQYEELASNTITTQTPEEILEDGTRRDMYKPYPNTYWGQGSSNERNTAFANIKKDMDLPAIGDRWNNPDLYQADISEETANQLPIGAYLVGPLNFYTRSTTPDPYILDFDIDDDKIPMNEPFVISFGVSDPNSVASEDDVLSSTVQCMRTDENEYVYPITQEHAGKEFVSNGHQLKVQEWVNAEKINYWDYDVEWMDTSDIYKTIKENDTGSTREWTVTRATNLGRYSPKLDPHNEEYNVFDPHYMAYGTRPPHYLDTPYQNLWSIDYTITRDQIQELDNVEKSGNQVTQWSQNTTVQEHPVIQDIAEQLRNVCDRIDATNNIEKVRVVADFVQYFTHRLDGTGVGATRTLPTNFYIQDSMNPLKTLYEAEGDCVSFTILANTILRTDYFDMNPDVAHIEDGGIFTADGRELGHVSTGIPYDEIVIDDVTDTEYSFVDPDDAVSRTNVSDAEYGDNLYVEMSSGHMLGSTVSSLAGERIASL